MSFSLYSPPSFLFLLIFCLFFLFFFNDPATTEIYTLSLHDALPISTVFLRPCRCSHSSPAANPAGLLRSRRSRCASRSSSDRKSTRLNSSHVEISYAVFCLKKKKKKKKNKRRIKRKKKK